MLLLIQPVVVAFLLILERPVIIVVADGIVASLGLAVAEVLVSFVVPGASICSTVIELTSN